MSSMGLFMFEDMLTEPRLLQMLKEDISKYIQHHFSDELIGFEHVDLGSGSFYVGWLIFFKNKIVYIITDYNIKTYKKNRVFEVNILWTVEGVTNFDDIHISHISEDGTYVDGSPSRDEKLIINIMGNNKSLVEGKLVHKDYDRLKRLIKDYHKMLNTSFQRINKFINEMKQLKPIEKEPKKASQESAIHINIGKIGDETIIKSTTIQNSVFVRSSIGENEKPKSSISKCPHCGEKFSFEKPPKFCPFCIKEI